MPSDLVGNWDIMNTILVNYVHPDYPGGVCVYCGETADSVDHLLPRGFTGDADRLRVPVVPACRECNSLLGDVYMPDIFDRRDYVHNKLKNKYKKYQNVMHWGESDLKAFGRQMRSMIVKQMREGDRLRARLSWPNKNNYDYDAWSGAWEEPVSVDENRLPMALWCLKSPGNGIPGGVSDIEKEPPSPDWTRGSISQVHKLRSGLNLSAGEDA
jgi:hypothetical protein